MKKDCLKILLISMLGLFVAVLGYPFFHEMGHMLASLLVDAEVLELSLLPVPSVLCDVTGVSDMGLTIIGFGGTLFPILISFFIPRKWFISWYFRALLQGMSILSLLISCVSVLFGVNPQDDMIQVLNFWQYGRTLLLIILGSSMLAVISAIVLDKPFKRVCKYFGL